LILTKEQKAKMEETIKKLLDQRLSMKGGGGDSDEDGDS
jgi:hypothetical protein